MLHPPDNEKPPFLKTWPQVYALVLGTLVGIILFLYFFTQHYK